MYWYEKEAAVFSPVISTRVRFARNLEKTPFPRTLSEEGRAQVWDKVSRAYEDRDMMKVPFEGLDPLVKRAYVDTRLASTALATAEKGAGLLISRDGEVAVMVNEEDHVRLQVICCGKAIREALEKAIDFAKHGEEKLPFAFRKDLGYLTACPTNLGAACRISVMIHLPALHALSAMPRLTKSLNDAGFTVRGAFGEGSRGAAGIYQISNQMSRERTPHQIAQAFEKVLSEVEERESAARQKLYATRRWETEDRICRAIGTLRYAKKISYSEFTTLFSLVRFGKALGLEEARDTQLPDRLLIQLAAAPMELSDGSLSDMETRDLARAKKLRGEKE